MLLSNKNNLNLNEKIIWKGKPKKEDVNWFKTSILIISILILIPFSIYSFYIQNQGGMIILPIITVAVIGILISNYFITITHNNIKYALTKDRLVLSFSTKKSQTMRS